MIPIVYPVDSYMRNYEYHRYRSPKELNEKKKKDNNDLVVILKNGNDYTFTYSADLSNHTEEVYSEDTYYISIIDEFV